MLGKFSSIISSNIGEKKDANELIYQMEMDPQISKADPWLTKGKCGGEG